MKNLLYIAGFSLLMTSCGEKANTTTTDSNPKDEMIVNTPNSNGLKIAYYVQDSLATGFEYFKTNDSLIKVKQLAFQAKLSKEYQKHQAYEAKIQQRMANNEISGFDLPNVEKEVMQRRERLAQMEQTEGAALQEESLERTNVMMNKISEAGKEFAKKNGIDLLFFYQKGGQINYISSAFDMTEEFISFLNNRENFITDEEK